MSKQRLFTVLRVVIAVVTLVAVVAAVVRNWEDVSVHLDQISWGTFALSTLAACLGTMLTMTGWRIILRDLGSNLRTAPAMGVYFVGQLGKYLPGSLWSVLVQADIAAGLGVPRRRTAVSSLVALGFGLATGLLVGLPSASYLLRGSTEGFAWWTLIAIPVVAVLVTPALLNRVIAQLLRVLKRPPLEHDLSARTVVMAFLIFVTVWLSFGVHTLLLSEAVAGAGARQHLVTASLTGYALSVSLGMILVILPAGLGAREGLLTLILSTVMPTAAAAAVAIVSRFIVTLVDVGLALVGWLYARAQHLLDARTRVLDPIE